MALKGSPMTRAFAAAWIAMLGGVAAPPAMPVAAQPVFAVDTTQDVAVLPEHCVPPAICPLRSALELANVGGGVVTAKLCENPGDAGCLSTLDPGYDAETGRWVIRIQPELAAFNITGSGVTLDFARSVAGWAGPQDNVIAIDGGTELGQALTVEGVDGVVTGLDIHGAFSTAALEIRIGATGNHVGPGIVIAGTSGQAAFRIRDTDTRQNELEGNWCGIDGSGRFLPVQGHCVLVERGATANVVRNNTLAGATGDGVALDGEGTTENVIEGNRIGPPPGEVGPAHGVRVTAGAGPNRVMGNWVWGSQGSGIQLADVFDVTVEANEVGSGGESADQGNSGWGIELRDYSKGSMIRANLVRFNDAGGILVTGGQATENTITRNVVTANDGQGIVVSGGANGRIEPPTVSNVSETRIAGLACNLCVLELYSDDGDEALTFEGQVTAASFGTFIFDKPEGFAGRFVTALQTQGRNTSGLADSKPVPGRVTPTVTPATPGPGTSAVIFLPWAGMKAPRP
jgi:hypothetical protein